jgi:hypothetical protein
MYLQVAILCTHANLILRLHVKTKKIKEYNTEQVVSVLFFHWCELAPRHV